MLFRSYNKESLVLFYIDAAVFQKRAQALIHDVPEKRRKVSNSTWKEGVMDLWALAYAIYEQYIDDPKMDIFRQPELARVKLDVYELPANAMFEKRKRDNTIEIEAFDAKRHKRALPFDCNGMKMYAFGKTIGGGNIDPESC